MPACVFACRGVCLPVGMRACARASFVPACSRACVLAYLRVDGTCLRACLLAGVRAGGMRAGVHGCLCASVCVGLGSCVRTRVLAYFPSRVLARLRRRTFAVPVSVNVKGFLFFFDFQTCMGALDVHVYFVPAVDRGWDSLWFLRCRLF